MYIQFSLSKFVSYASLSSGHEIFESMSLYIENTAATAKSLQSCPTLCDPVDGSPPGSFVHGIFQVRVLEWGAIAFSDIENRGV